MNILIQIARDKRNRKIREGDILVRDLGDIRPQFFRVDTVNADGTVYAYRVHRDGQPCRDSVMHKLGTSMLKAIFEIAG